MDTFKVIGTRPPRLDATEKVAGRAVFGPDVMLPRLAHGKILRSPHAHARILEIDTSRAEKLTGVYAIITAGDLPEAADRTERLGEGSVNFRYMRDNTLAGDKVLYHGHPVAAVAARTARIAAEATRLIDVRYEALPAVVDVRKAMAEDAPILHEHIRTDSLAGAGERPTNVAAHFQHLRGDPEKGFVDAEVVVERVFETETVHQGYIEPHAGTAVWSSDNSVTIHTTTQGSFDVRSHMRELLHLPESGILIVPTEVGGAFGGKNMSFVDVAAALLAKKAGRPVRIIMTQQEVLLATGPSSGTWIRVKIGATKDGQITAVEAELCYEAGAYPGSPAGAGAANMFAPYDIPNGRIDGYDVLVNKPRAGPYRAPGTTPVNFAVETLVDEIADKLDFDPFEMRLKNCAVDGTESITGTTLAHSGGHQVIEAARGHSHWGDPIPESRGSCRVGRGVAFGYWGNWGARSSVTITLNGDGSLALLTGSVDVSGTRTSIAMQAAEELGVDLPLISSDVADTNSSGHSETSAGSRTTMATGVAAVEAARDLILQMCGRVASLWEIQPGDVVYSNGAFSSIAGSRTITITELAGKLGETGGAVRGKGDVNVRKWGGAFAAHIADVEVDIETGKVRVIRYTAVQDVGRAIHPGQVEGQLQGGVAQGIGWALYEGYKYDGDGRMLNPHFLDYKMPTMLDVPRIDTVLVENPWPEHPFGVRGVGEVPIVPPPAAIANAIFRAVGTRLDRLPMTPERILESLGVI